MALAGSPILGSYRSVKGGHRLNAYVLRKLFADADAWTTVRAPWVRETGPVDVSAGVAAVNYAADRT
jgi:UDP-3-O-[3-hydroxymyristoyl] N-acetylglucosamine deacetylase